MCTQGNLVFWQAFEYDGQTQICLVVAKLFQGLPLSFQLQFVMFSMYISVQLKTMDRTPIAQQLQTRYWRLSSSKIAVVLKLFILQVFLQCCLPSIIFRIPQHNMYEKNIRRCSHLHVKGFHIYKYIKYADVRR